MDEGSVRLQSYRAGLNDSSGGRYTQDLIAARDEARREWEDEVVKLEAKFSQILAACKAVEPILRKNLYPCPDKPNSDWAKYKKLADAIAEADDE